MAEAMARCSSDEFAYWMAYDSTEPIGDERQDIGPAIVAACLSGKRVGEMMPRYWDRQKPRQSQADMKAVVLGAAAAFERQRKRG